MVNVEAITSRLSMMPDQALQQYAMMHKNDPYVLALAVSESNRRKEMRAAAVPPAQEQPKVADQALASMLPEQQGIGQLPAEMNFADGGIVAFAGGGDVERYQVGGITPNLMAQYQKEIEEMGYGQRMQFSPEVKAIKDRIEGEKQASYLQQEQQRMLSGGRDIVRGTPAPSIATMPAPGYTRAGMANDPRLLGSVPVEAPATAAQNVSAPTGGIDQLVPPAARPTAGAPSTGSIVSRAKDMASQIYDPSEINKALDEQKTFIEGRTKGIEEAYAKRPTTKAFEGLEASLRKEEEAEAGEKEQATGMAIFKAGLAMMSGNSPYALQNIGKGALVGAEEYSSAIKDFKKAAKDRQKLQAEIEEKRRLQAVGDWEAAMAKDDKIAGLQQSIHDKVLRAAETTTGKSADIAGALVGKELDRQAQIALKGMPSYADTQEKQLLQQWLAKPENKGKTELDARLELGIGVGKGTASISDRIRGYQTILNDMTASDEDKAEARSALRTLIAGQSKQTSGGAPAAPKIGDVVQGYRFKGGDPSNQANWEKVK